MATNRVVCSYEEIIDLNTVEGQVTAIGIHTPTGSTPIRMFPGLFQQFRKWRYLGCSVVGANAAQLPIDPLGVSYEPGEGNDAVMAPGDVFNPVLFHGCHGDDLGAILNQLYITNQIGSDSVDFLTSDENTVDGDMNVELMRGLYYKALTDRTWKKFGIQSGFRLRGLHPLVYSLATNHQISPSLKGGVITVDENGDIIDETGIGAIGFPPVAENIPVVNDRQFFTPRLVALGSMDTRLPTISSAIEIPVHSDTSYGEASRLVKSVTNYTTMPKIFMGVLLLPESQRVKQFLRIIIKHRFVFYGFRGASLNDNILGSPSFFDDRYVGDAVTDYGVSQNDSMFNGGGSDIEPEPTPPEPEPELTYSVTVTGRYSANPSFMNAIYLATEPDSIVDTDFSVNGSSLPVTWDVPQSLNDEDVYLTVVSQSSSMYIGGGPGTGVSMTKGSAVGNAYRFYSKVDLKNNPTFDLGVY